jgi:hypothetical protein
MTSHRDTRIAAGSIRQIQNAHEHAIDMHYYEPWFPRRILVGADEIHYAWEQGSTQMHPWDAMHMVRSYAAKHLRSRGFTELPSGSWATGSTDSPKILPSLVQAILYDACLPTDEEPPMHPNVEWQTTTELDPEEM